MRNILLTIAYIRYILVLLELSSAHHQYITKLDERKQGRRKSARRIHMDLLQRMTENELRNAIWMCRSGMCPIGGRALEDYENELFRRTGDKKGYHE